MFFLINYSEHQTSSELIKWFHPLGYAVKLQGFGEMWIVYNPNSQERHEKEQIENGEKVIEIKAVGNAILNCVLCQGSGFA